MNESKIDLIFLSIRLMTYNHEDYIVKALDSIDKQQTNFDFEAVIGDDFSTDDTLKIIKKYNFKNPNLHIKVLNRQKGDEYGIERQKKGRIYNFTNILENCDGNRAILQFEIFTVVFHIGGACAFPARRKGPNVFLVIRTHIAQQYTVLWALRPRQAGPNR